MAQIGGDTVIVTSILSDPNVDPHEYESSVEDATAIATADLVIENGGGYDDWMDKLLSASPRGARGSQGIRSCAGRNCPIMNMCGTTWTMSRSSPTL